MSQQQVTAGKAPLALEIPEAPTALNISVALCSTETPFPKFFVGDGSVVLDPTIDNAGQEIFLDGGVAFWNGTGPATLYAFADSGSTGSRFFEVALSSNGKPCNQLHKSSFTHADRVWNRVYISSERLCAIGLW